MAIFYDLEFYVPEDQRNSSVPLVFNATRTEQVILGGVFLRHEPYRKASNDQYKGIWVWDDPYFDYKQPRMSEYDVLKQIYELYREEYSETKQRLSRQNSNAKPKIYTIGIGNARVDRSALFIRAMEHNIASKEELFETFLGSYPVDLSNAMIGFMEPKEEFMIKPLRTRQILNRLEIDHNRESGKGVWDYYDSQNYELIENRTYKEVKQIHDIYHKMTEKMQF